MLLTYRRNQIDNWATHAWNQSFEWTPVRTGIILGRRAKLARPLLKKSSVDQQKRVGCRCDRQCACEMRVGPSQSAYGGRLQTTAVRLW